MVFYKFQLGLGVVFSSFFVTAGLFYRKIAVLMVSTGLFYKFQLGLGVVFSSFFVTAGLFYRKIDVL